MTTIQSSLSASSLVSSPALEAVKDCVIDGVAVVHICPLLDGVFGVGGWYGIDPDVMQARVDGWVCANEAHFYEWEGESFLRLAERDKAVAAALRAGRSVVVIRALS